MADQWTVEIEPASGDTTTTTQALVPLRWERAAITLRRRAPHELTITIPRTSHHRLTDFTAFRELKVTRNGVAWLSGFQGAATAPGGEESATIELAGWGNAMALLFGRNTTGNFSSNTASGLTTAQIITTTLAQVDHGAAGDWFPAANNSIAAGTITLPWYDRTSKSALEVLMEMCDLEGWEWRATAGYGIQAGPSVSVNRTASLLFYSPANCRITSHSADPLALATNLGVFARIQAAKTTVTALAGGGTSTLTVESTTGFYPGDLILIKDAAGTYEYKTINTVPSTTSMTLTSTLAGPADVGEEVSQQHPLTFKVSTSAAAAAVSQAHHVHYLNVYNDQLRNPTTRDSFATALRAIYDSVPSQVTVRVTDAALIAQCLDAGLLPGDTVSLTSAWLPYSATSLVVQEMALELAADGPPALTLALGDPLRDGLAVLEQRTRAGQAAATAIIT